MTPKEVLDDVAKVDMMKAKRLMVIVIPEYLRRLKNETKNNRLAV